MSKNAQNVTVGKPAVAGAVFNAPAGTALPTSTAASLNSAFVDLGYVSEDGVTNSFSLSTDQIKAWGGEVVAVPQSEKVETVKLKLIEAMNTDVLKVFFGASNVSGSLSEGVAVNVDNAELGETAWVIDTILRGGTAQRLVIPRGKISEMGDVVYKDNELIGYEVTLTCLPDSSGKSQYIYIKAASST